MKYAPKLEKVIMCPIEYGLDAFGGKWKSRILCVLSAAQILRYSEIRNGLGNISDAVLASMLKELLNDGLIRREQHSEIPPRVEYALTPKGKSVLPILKSICQWSRLQTEDGVGKTLPPCQTCEQLIL
jgi:DNA-binding HxlR family transcriptional regulator